MILFYISMAILFVGLFGILHQVTSGRMHPLATWGEMTLIQWVFFFCVTGSLVAMCFMVYTVFDLGQ